MFAVVFAAGTTPFVIQFRADAGAAPTTNPRIATSWNVQRRRPQV